MHGGCKFNMPKGMKLIAEGGLPAGYNKLDLSFSDSKQVREQLHDIEVECSVDNEEPNTTEALPVVSVDGTDNIESSVFIETVDGDECIEKKGIKSGTLVGWRTAVLVRCM